MAAQRVIRLPDSRADRGPQGVADDFYRKVVLNKNADYRRERSMTVINAADVARPDQIKTDSASCLIKMTMPCFDSFKQAFIDPESRVRLNSDRPEHYASAIERIRFIGGYLDGVDIELSDHLNALIGGGVPEVHLAGMHSFRTGPAAFWIIGTKAARHGH